MLWDLWSRISNIHELMHHGTKDDHTEHHSFPATAAEYMNSSYVSGDATSEVNEKSIHDMNVKE